MPLRRPIPLAMLAMLAVVAVVAAAAATPADTEPSGRIFSWRQAERARQLARDECKPLVVHFVPDNTLGAKQLDSFYVTPGGVPRELLDEVVIVVAPIDRFRRFAGQLGVTGAGGYRTISAYDLSPVDEKSQPTCRSGYV